MAEVTARLNELRMKIRTLEEPYRAVVLAGEVQEVPGQRAARHRDARSRADARTSAARESGDSDGVCREPEIDRLMKPEDLQQKKDSRRS